jgi:hypothetical protein
MKVIFVMVDGVRGTREVISWIKDWTIEGWFESEDCYLVRK